MNKILTSFTAHKTAEGQRISYTYSEIDENGNLIAQNKRENFIVVSDDLQSYIDGVESYITENKLNIS